jgi:hypothetical protein
MKTKKVKTKLTIEFTEDEAKLIQSAAYALYQYIGYDIPAETKRGTIKRDTLIEVIIDANRLEEELRKKDHALADKFNNADYDSKLAVVRPGFPFREYEAGPSDL